MRSSPGPSGITSSSTCADAISSRAFACFTGSFHTQRSSTPACAAASRTVGPTWPMKRSSIGSGERFIDSATAAKKACGA